MDIKKRQACSYLLPDPGGSVVRECLGEIELLQAKIDALMLEYCPNEMTEEQKANWAKHQRAVKVEEPSD